MFVKRPRWRSERYLDFVRRRCCAHCYAPPPSQAHHWHAREKGMGRKPDDCFTVPLCHVCHRHFHDHGKLPGLTPLLTDLDFEREQRRCMADFLRTYVTEPVEEAEF